MADDDSTESDRLELDQALISVLPSDLLCIFPSGYGPAVSIQRIGKGGDAQTDAVGDQG